LLCFLVSRCGFECAQHGALGFELAAERVECCGYIVVCFSHVWRRQCEHHLKFRQRFGIIPELETQLTSLRVQFVIKWTDEEARLQSVECLLPFAELEPEARDRLQCLQVVLVSLYQGVESFCC